MSVNLTEADRLRLRACDREIRRARIRLDRERVEKLLHDKRLIKGMPSTVRKVAFQTGARNHGVRRRCFNLIPTCAPALKEWRETM
eukprot:4721884-Pyramimonas_sp.AAC.1